MSEPEEGNAFEAFTDPSPKGGRPSAKLLFDYEKHYMQLLSAHKGDIEFISNLLKELRTEQDKSTERIIALDKKLDEQNIAEEVKNLWLKHLAENLNRSFQLSFDLISHYMIMEHNEFMMELQKRINS